MSLWSLKIWGFKMIKIYIMNGPDEGRSFEFEDSVVHVGRSARNDLQLKDVMISRAHIKIFQRGNKYFLEDLKSKNGTRVKGKRIRSGKMVEIEEGAPIAVGRTLISIGEPFLGDILRALDTIDLFKEVEEGPTSYITDRPMTAKNNFDLILKVSDVLMESLDIHDTLKRILHYIMDLLKRIDRGVIILIDEETGHVQDVVSMFKKRKDDTITMYSRTIVDRVVRERKAVIMLDTFGEDRTALSDSIEIQQIRSILCIPLIARSHVMGVLYVDSVNRPHGFRNDDLSLLTALSSPAAMAIENAMLQSGETNRAVH